MKQIIDYERILDRNEDFIIVGETDKGPKEENNDIISYAVHPNFPNVKLLVLADGDSKAKEGAAGAQLICDQIENKFIKLKEEDFDNVGQALLNMSIYTNKFISEFNKVFHRECIAVGAVAIIIDDKCYCLTIGDVRVYYSIDGKINKINNLGTDYDALENYHNELKAIDYPEERLYKFLNSIDPNSKQTPFKQIGRFNVISDDDIHYVEGFESIFIMSNGVSNHISDKNTEKVIKYTDPELVPRTLIQFAECGYTIINNSVAYEENHRILRSKDNLSVIGYARANSKKLTKAS